MTISIVDISITFTLNLVPLALACLWRKFSEQPGAHSYHVFGIYCISIQLFVVS